MSPNKQKHESTSSPRKLPQPTSFTENSPHTLMQICLSFIGISLSLVDSFVDLPEVIGKQIFDSAARQGMFDARKIDLTMIYHYIQIFSEAYADALMSKLNLRDCHLEVNNYLEHLLLFTCLEEVDLSNCGLGDGHEFIHHFGKLERLKVLNLHNNGLTDEGVRKLTTPVRMFKRGPLQLNSLDISGNTQISKKVTKYLICFKNLSLLNVTATNVQISDKYEIKEKLHLEYKERAKSSLPVIRNTGWASDVVTRWMSDKITSIKSEVTARNEKSSAQKFYTRKRKRQDILAAETHEVASKPLLLFQKLKDFDPATKSTQSYKGDSFTFKKPKKISNSRNIFVDDDDDDLLLSLYSSGKNSKPQSFADVCCE